MSGGEHTGPGSWEVTAVRYATRETSKADCYLGYPLYGEADAPLTMDYFFYVVTNGERTLLIDTGYGAEPGARRKRTTIVPPVEALARLGIAPEEITELLITHFHYDHVGNVHSFPRAELILPRRELEFWTGPLAERLQFAVHVEQQEIAHIAEAHAAGRVRLLDRQGDVAPGITTHHVGGHSPGQVVVVVQGKDGPIVLTSDTVHYYEELELERPFAILTDLEEMYTAFGTVRELASAPGAQLVVGHDPTVLDRFPHVTDGGGILGARIR